MTTSLASHEMAENLTIDGVHDNSPQTRRPSIARPGRLTRA